jgi:transcriptional regulator with XRE-family HTH domain
VASEDEADTTERGSLTQDFLSVVGARIRELRTARSLTVQQLADRAGISRRLMTQIELGQANPSLVTVSRIARRLGTEFTELLQPAGGSAIEARAPGEHVLVWTGEAGSTAHLLQATTSRSADMWLWTLLPGDTYRGRPDPAHSQELFYVVSGALLLSAPDQEVEVGAGSSARLRSDRPYSYRTATRGPVVFVRTVALAR